MKLYTQLYCTEYELQKIAKIARFLGIKRLLKWANGSIRKKYAYARKGWRRDWALQVISPEFRPFSIYHKIQKFYYLDLLPFYNKIRHWLYPKSYPSLLDLLESEE